MERKRLHGGRLREAGYDERARRLEIVFTDDEVRVHEGVPREVWQRLLAAPNPAAYHADRIADEYPWKRGAAPAGAGARAAADALFGKPPGDAT